MEWIVKNLEREANHKEITLGTTPPTDWDGTQETWDAKEKQKINELRTAASLLKKKICGNCGENVNPIILGRMCPSCYCDM